MAGSASGDSKSASRARWPGIESDPDVFTELFQKIGLPGEWQIVEVLGLDEELLGFVPGPVQALIMCYPHTNEVDFDTPEYTVFAADDADLPFFLNQLPELGNACGTIACLHGALNAPDVQLKDGALKDFLERTASLTPEQRGKELDVDDRINKAHGEAATHGVGGADAGAEEVDYHFVCLVRRGHTLYELDGLKKLPLVHGSTAPETFLTDAAAALRRKYTDKEPNGRFALMAITAA